MIIQMDQDDPYKKISKLKYGDSISKIFKDANHGTPDNITQPGCLALAECGKNVWNEWREAFPSRPYGHILFENITDFSFVDFSKSKIQNFEGFLFGDGADFSFCKWERNADFFSASWGDSCNFTGVSWGKRGIFNLATWGNNCNFQGSHWGHDSIFENAFWGYNTNFSNTYWEERIYFNGAHFGSNTNFDLSIWLGAVSFSGCGVSGLSNATILNPKDERTPVIINSKTYQEIGKITFMGAKFHGKVFFDDRNFTDGANFSSFTSNESVKIVCRDNQNDALYENNELKYEVAGEQELISIFHYPPHFFGTELHPNTSFDNVKFPPPSGCKESVRIYRDLKLKSGNQKAIREEQRFFRLEMKEEKYNSQGIQKMLYWSYHKFSNFGFSVKRPIMFLVISGLLFCSIYLAIS